MRLRSSLRPMLVALAVAVLPGCLGLDTGPNFALLQSVVREGEALAEFSRASGGNAAMTVSGQIVGRLPCDEVRGEISESGDRIDVTIVMVADRQSCNGREPTTHSYIGNILNLDPGSKTVKVRYRYQGTEGQNGVVLDTVVTVG